MWRDDAIVAVLGSMALGGTAPADRGGHEDKILARVIVEGYESVRTIVNITLQHYRQSLSIIPVFNTFA